jgi:hypothetical protein
VIAVIYIDFTQVPVRVQFLRKFTAADPWHDGSSAEWTLNLYRMVMENQARKGQPAFVPELADSEKISGDPRQALLRGDEAIGIETGGWYRLLPRVLARLWASGEVADDLLPRLIKAMEPRLRRRDFLRPAAKDGLWLLAWLSGAAAAACVAAFLVLAPARGHALAIVDRQEWLSARLVPQTVWLTGGGIDIKGSIELGSSEISRPPGLNLPTGSNALGWFDASSERRLILFRPNNRPAVSRLQTGPIVSAADLGIPNARLAALKRQVPDVNTDYVLVDEGFWIDQASAPAFAPILPWLAGLLSIPVAVCFVLDTLRKARDRRIETGFRSAMVNRLS